MNLKHFTYAIEYKINEERAHEEYKDLYAWILDNIEKDKSDINFKELKYLLESYDEVEELIDNEIDNIENITKLMLLDREESRKFSMFSNMFREDYNYLNDIEEDKKHYRHYNRILSWYSMAPETIDKVIDNLSKNKKCNMKIDSNKSYTEILKANQEGALEISYNID